jgi:hypothetical protein
MDPDVDMLFVETTESIFEILIDCEFISIKNSQRGVIYRCGLLVVNKHTLEEVEEYDLWINYNLYKMIDDTRRWKPTLRWLNANEQYSAGYNIMPTCKHGISIQYLRKLISGLLYKYRVAHLRCKGISTTDLLLSNKVQFIEIIAPKYEGVHEPLNELKYFKNYL